MRPLLASIALVVLSGSAGCARADAPPPGTVVVVRDQVTLREIAPGVYLHTAIKDLPKLGPTPSNGVVAIGEREAILIDTTWDDATTAALVDHVERVLRRKVTHAVVTHSHDDRMGGIRELLRRQIPVHGLDVTAHRARIDGNPPPSVTFTSEATVDADGVRAELFFPGPAHAPDNIVVWLPAGRVLVGGCMIRAGDATHVGNKADASLATWPDAVRAVQARFPSPAIVVPGHGAPGDASLVAHTADLVGGARP